jgi:hypothetical protein
MLNTIEFDSINNKLSEISKKLSDSELFFSGVPISLARIKDASITDAKIANLSIVNAKFENLAITNAKIGSVDAEKITAGTISADRIGATSITADKIDVSSLSVISADIGTITSGDLTGITIIGGTIRSASSGSRVELTASPNAMIVYDGGTQRFIFDPDGFRINNGTMHLMTLDFETFKGSFFRYSGTIVRFQSGGTTDFIIANITAGGDIQFVAADGEININASGTVRVNGVTKTAILPTSKGYRSLYCLESPDVWFMDFAKSEKNIDPLFLEVTEREKNILKTDQGELLIFRKRKGCAKKRFENKTFEQFDRNNNFWGVV